MARSRAMAALLWLPGGKRRTVLRSVRRAPVRAIALWRIAELRIDTALARIAHLARRMLAHRETALRLVAQYGHELGALAGLGAETLVRDDDRRARRRGRRNAVEHILRNGDAVERAFGVGRTVDGDDAPAQPGLGLRHRGEHVR